MSERYSVNEMKGKFCLALFSGDRMYYRGYIKSVSKDNLAQVSVMWSCNLLIVIAVNCSLAIIWLSCDY